jgi:type I restriction enzyme S subunit
MAATRAVAVTALRRFKPYPAYKDSGVAWLGEIPAHWDVKRLKRLVEFRGGGTPTKERLEYWRGEIPWVSPKDMKVWLVAETEDKITARAVQESATKLVPLGAVLIVVRSGILVHSIPVAIAARELTLNQDLKALIPRASLVSDYLARFISGLQRELLAEWKREGATVESLELDLVADTPTLLPPGPEQRAIAAFLDRETARTDTLVAKRERLIELLQERRTALVTRAVSKGLDPIVQMKNSGIEWMGEIPADWDVMRLRSTVTSCQNGVWGDEPDGVHDMICVRVADFDRVGHWVDMSDPTLRTIDTRSAAAHGLRHGDLLLEKSGGGEQQPVGALVMYNHEGSAVCSNFIARVTVAAGHDPRYLTFLHASLYSQRLNTRHIKQSTGIQNLDSSSYLAEPVGIPQLSEQRTIAAFLDRETTQIDAVIAKVRESIERLNELRAALIGAAVTGKIDVREEAG